MGVWTGRRMIAALGGAVLTAVVIAVPTDLIDTPLFGRSVPVTWWAWPVLAVTAVLSGLLLATYVRAGERPAPDRRRLGALGGLLSLLAVGCPVCNKLVLLALGTSGAMTWFAPAQPLLAGVSVVLLTWALVSRVRAERRCPVPVRADG